MTQYIQKLPPVFQTVVEKKFFDATFDQVLSKKDSDYLAGYIGRRNPGEYNPITDFYVPEPSKNRTWWQLEATAYARDTENLKSNIFFYDDLLERIEYYGGNTLNQDRLFESEYYSFGPPIDYDMFVNYTNYYWIEQGLPSINIYGVLASDIIGKTSYTTPPTAIPPNLTLSTGMPIVLVDDPEYSDIHLVENFGNCNGIGLVPKLSSINLGTVYELLPWDGSIELSTGRIISNTNWDVKSWDAQTQPTTGDYITIERGSIDRNAWSRSNKWFHIETINTVLKITNTEFPTNAIRALRPIIQFIADLELYKSGTQYKNTIQYGFRNNYIGSPILLSEMQGQQIADINLLFNINLKNEDLVSFFNDNTVVDTESTVNQYIYTTYIEIDGTVNFYNTTPDRVINGDIVFITKDAPYNGAHIGQTWYYENSNWNEVYNEKLSANQPPLFQLYDHDGVSLNNEIKYPNSNFNGSPVFSYKVNTISGATVDPVLKFPIVYKDLGEVSDIVFQNNLITDRYTYSLKYLPIDGYYYYKTSTSPILYNSWNLYQPCTCSPAEILSTLPEYIETSKQRVIDKYVVGYGSEYSFKLSVTPYYYPENPDIIVSVNGIEVKNSSLQDDGYTFSEINNRIYVNLTAYLTTLMLTTQSQPPVVEILTYTHDLLDPAYPGYFEIPQQLEANATQEEVSELSSAELTPQFISIIQNQLDFSGTAYGGNNNYRDSGKNRSVGSYILQNVAPALKSMLISSSDDLDFIAGVRFSGDEYTKFKNKFLSTALQLIKSEFNPVSYHNNTIDVNAWVGEIVRRISVSNEFSNAFAYSYMVATGAPNKSEYHAVPVDGNIILSNYVDLSDPKNALYIYDTTGQVYMLTIGYDYEIVSNNLIVELHIDTSKVPVGNLLYFSIYNNPLPTYIPSTPSKVGAYPIYFPRIELDTSYAIPTEVIIGHDGSKTIIFGDYRDQLLLELERRIYNGLLEKFRNQYYVPLRIQSVSPGYFRKTRYTRQEYLDITQSYLNKWSAKNRANYRVNDWASASEDTPVNSLWKLYNYKYAKDTAGNQLNLPGNWKGIYQYYYDTYQPDIAPWGMLGFSQEPSWWVDQYGPGIINSSGQTSWPNTPAYANMWSDLESGIIRQGPSAIFDPITLEPQPQPMWARPGLSSVIPVDSNGDIISVMTLFDVVYSGNPYEPFDYFDIDWQYGDGAPVEQAWMSTSVYAFNVQEFLYLMRPGPYGELFWDTAGTELSPGKLIIPGTNSPVMSNINWQYVQNESYTDAWMRPKNSNQIVHAENIDNIIQVRYGYQRWISDRILFLGKDIGKTFGQKIRTLNVNLANKFAGFTSKDTVNIYVEGISPISTTPTLILPSTNFDVKLHKSPPVNRYAYSGVIIRAVADGTFIVYGYDLLNSSFSVLDRSDEKIVDITVGGTPAPFLYFEHGQAYNAGDIVRYNGIYYQSLITQVADKFSSDNWKKLVALPIIGGVSVDYKPVSLKSVSVIPYGSVLPDTQSVFDFLIGWGAYLENEGWKFDDVDSTTNQINNWLTSAKQFLFWLNTNWAPDASIQLSPLANKATVIVKRGYPNDVETMSNGVYSVLDKYGAAISPTNTVVYREGPLLSVEPSNLSVGGIYFLQVTASETEHILIFDNVTSFNDTVYSPLLRARQERLRFNGFRSNAWYGKMEAPGYLVIEDQLVPNFDTIVDNMKYFYDPNVTLDNTSIEDLGRHLIGYESKSYLDNLELSNDIQYLFYQGAIREKGTKKALEKLFRSTKVKSNEDIEVYEEWALKLGEYGNTIDQVSTEFILNPEKNSGEVIVARLNYVPSPIGFVKQISIMNAEDIYPTVPKIIISSPDATPSETWSVFSDLSIYNAGDIVKYVDSVGNIIFYSSKIDQGPGPFVVDNWTSILVTRIAKAYAILDSAGRISRIDISDPGYGYLTAPSVTIDSGSIDHNLDKLYSVWQGEIIKDETLDNIVNIDIDQPNVWTVRPLEPLHTLKLPTTDNINYTTPNAGYVNFNDVDWYSYDVNTLLEAWGTNFLNPVSNDTIWIADNFVGDWSVYKLFNFTNTAILSWKIIAESNGDILLLTPYSNIDPSQNITIIPQLWNSSTINRTDFGNMIVVQQVVNNTVVDTNTYTVGFIPYITDDYENPGTYLDPDELVEYNAYRLTNIDGIPVTTADMPLYSDLNSVLLYKSMRWTTTPTEPLLPIYVGIEDLIWVDNVNDKWAVFKIQAKPGIWENNPWDVEIPEYWKVPKYVSPSNGGPISPEFAYGWDVSSPLYFNLHRLQSPLIDTSLFESATIFTAAKNKNSQLVLLPIFDPFKDILPGPAKQNLTYIVEQDPARYNVTGDNRLFSKNVVFGKSQVGQLWWDLSSTRYVYYEQPVALDGSETELDNLVYRRNNWGRIFPGSEIKIYEWVQSDVPPISYTGTGTPKDTTSYVEIVNVDKFTNSATVKYYFWVLNSTDKPNIENRTLAALDVAQLLKSPKKQQFSFFCPIQQTSTNNSYMFYNINDVLLYKGNNVQIQYRLSQRNDQKHTQWSFFREGDKNSIVTDQFWNKMVDSLCGYTKLLPVSTEYANGIIIANYLPWDIYGWDVSPYDDATSTTTPIYGEILPVPDPMLGQSEKLGIEYRPRQSMFTDIYSARKIFVQSANSLLKYIPIRDNAPDWNADVPTDIYWEYTNWYKVGYEDVVPQVVFTTLSQALVSLNLGELSVGTIVQVIEGTTDGRYVLYAVTQPNTNVNAYTLEEVGIENSAIKLLNTIYTVKNVYNLSVELRALLNAFRSIIMINEFLVDQNELYFSMLNFVLSEQRNPNWLFKSSYIYIKENNIPLTQTHLYVPDPINNIIEYIQDSKPYHTQVRDYTKVYVTSDIADGTSSDLSRLNMTLQFGPEYGGPYPQGHWDVNCNTSMPEAWDNYSWDVCPEEVNTLEGQTFGAASGIFGANPLLITDVDQFVSQEDTYTIPLTFFDESKVGYSQLYPYTFSLDVLNGDLVSIIPQNIVGVTVGNTTLIYGQDYYVENNNNGTYTVYFYNDPSPNIPDALVWFFGGSNMLYFNYSTARTEIAYGFPRDDFVINVNTKKPVSIDSYDFSLPAVVLPNGDIDPSWFNSLNYVLTDDTLSYKLNLSPTKNPIFYRNYDKMAGELVTSLPAPTVETENINIITVFVDPTTHTNTNILPDPVISGEPGVIWINGERIEYLYKTPVSENTWELKLVYRGTQGTGITEHAAGSKVFIEKDQRILGTYTDPNNEVWNSYTTPAMPNLSTYMPPNIPWNTLPWDTFFWDGSDRFSNILETTAGGLWYSTSSEALFLQNGPGSTEP